MKISQIRETLEASRWNRNDATGGTRDENRRTDLPARLLPHLAKVAALQIPARFAREIEQQADEIHYLGKVLARWQASQIAPANVIAFKQAA